MNSNEAPHNLVEVWDSHNAIHIGALLGHYFNIICLIEICKVKIWSTAGISTGRCDVPNAKRSYCYHSKVDYFPLTGCPDVFCFLCTTAVCQH